MFMEATSGKGAVKGSVGSANTKSTSTKRQEVVFGKTEITPVTNCSKWTTSMADIVPELLISAAISL